MKMFQKKYLRLLQIPFFVTLSYLLCTQKEPLLVYSALLILFYLVYSTIRIFKDMPEIYESITEIIIMVLLGTFTFMKGMAWFGAIFVIYTAYLLFRFIKDNIKIVDD